MPINKNAIIRYQILDKCFRNPGRNYYFRDLLEEVNKALYEEDQNSAGIKRRQLFDDIRFMESEIGWSVPLERIKDGKRVFYRYSDIAFSINNQPLNEEEAEQIKSALMILARIKGQPQFDWVNELIPKIQQTFGFVGEESDIISFDSNQYLKGIENIGRLFNAILYKKPLEIKYQSFKSSKPDSSVIHPYYLKQYNNRWFLFGKIEKFMTISVRALDRIVNIKEVDQKYIDNDEFDFSDYFEDVIGITKQKETTPEIIELHFTSDQAPYILTKPIHGSQKIKKINENGLWITIEVITNFELETLILSFGETVKVTSPTRFQKVIRERLQEAVDNYDTIFLI